MVQNAFLFLLPLTVWTLAFKCDLWSSRGLAMLLGFRIWRTRLSPLESGKHWCIRRGKVHICMSPCLAVRFCFLARKASLGPTALRLCWWMSYNSACVFCNANRLPTETVFTSESLKLPHIHCSWCYWPVLPLPWLSH